MTGSDLSDPLTRAIKEAFGEYAWPAKIERVRELLTFHSTQFRSGPASHSKSYASRRSQRGLALSIFIYPLLVTAQPEDPKFCSVTEQCHAITRARP
jgi:hypothetical protein